SVTVNQTLTSIAVTPATATVPQGMTQSFTATSIDQFGNPLSPQPGCVWTVSGLGSVTVTGINTFLYSAPAPGAGTGTATLTASNGSVQGSATIIVTPTLGVVSSVCQEPSTNNLAVVHFLVTFTTSVTGVDVSDFVLSTGLSGATITGVTA